MSIKLQVTTVGPYRMTARQEAGDWVVQLHYQVGNYWEALVQARSHDQKDATTSALEKARLADLAASRLAGEPLSTWWHGFWVGALMAVLALSLAVGCLH